MVSRVTDAFKSKDSFPPPRVIQVWRDATPLGELWVVIASGDICIETLNLDAPYNNDQSAIDRAYYEAQKYGMKFDGKILNCDYEGD